MQLHLLILNLLSSLVLLGIAYEYSFLAFCFLSSPQGLLCLISSMNQSFIHSLIQAGTWEEKSLNYWAIPRIKVCFSFCSTISSKYICFVNLSLFNLYIFIFLSQELLISVGSIPFSSGRAEVEDVTKCAGDVSLLNVLHLD
jgi:hypothetical protein